jgi:hypothetical protein
MLATQVYKKLTYTGHHLHFDPNHPPTKSCLQPGSYSKYHLPKKQEFLKDIEHIKRELALNGYPSSFVDSIVKGHTVTSQLEIGGSFSTIVIPHVKGVSEKFRCIWN